MKEMKSICIIDDDKVYTYGVKKIIKSLTPEGNITTFENGRKAIEGIKKMMEQEHDLPDLILLDIDMPEMNGWDFLNEFESIRFEIKKAVEVFVISSRIDTKKQELYQVEWDEKVSDFIKKPVQTETLKALLN